jgi:diacylglycerol kinase (ATP)
MNRWSELDVDARREPATLILNTHAGRKLGIVTNTETGEQVQAALRAAGIRFEPRPTEAPGHATDLAREAARQGRRLVIAAGGDGTASEAARGLAYSETVLALMPFGSIMNVARMLWIPRDPDQAAQRIVEGRVLAIDLGRIGDRFFLEAAGVGLDAGLFGYFARLEAGARPEGVLRGLLRFLRQLGKPAVTLTFDGQRLRSRAPLVSIANGPYVGAAYAIAPGARIDDGLLDVVVFREASVVRVLVHLAFVAGGRPLPPPPTARILRARAVEVAKRHGRPLPTHVDGVPVGVTPARFEAAPGALKVVVGRPEASGICPWDQTLVPSLTRAGSA